ncbi:hypothetical protein C8R44DRAFT_847297 [Mycena epipterygia]|nr:hypothetical protein C8R44DRAFT_847297 [Mycena epipterygia]
MSESSTQPQRIKERQETSHQQFEDAFAKFREDLTEAGLCPEEHPALAVALEELYTLSKKVNRDCAAVKHIDVNHTFLCTKRTTNLAHVNYDSSQFGLDNIKFATDEEVERYYNTLKTFSFDDEGVQGQQASGSQR